MSQSARRPLLDSPLRGSLAGSRRPLGLRSRELAGSREAFRASRRKRARPSEPRRGESRGGKSDLRWAVRRVTPGQGNLTESGTENIPPASAPSALRRGKPVEHTGRGPASPKSGGRRRVRVKRCGKSAPRSWQHEWQAKPRTEQDQIGWRSRTARPKPPGRSLEPASNRGPR